MKRIVRKAMAMAAIERPGDVGMDLPPGATAQQLTPADYHPLDMEVIEEKPPRKRRTMRKAVRARRIRAHA